MKARPCRSCRVPIVDIPTNRGKTMPMERAFWNDMDEVEFANTPAPVYDHKIHQAFNHFAKCPNADAHRRGKR